VRDPRRLAEDSDLFAKLVAEDDRVGPPPEALRGLLKTLDATAADAAVPAPRAASNAWRWLALVGASVVVLVPALRSTSLSMSREPTSSITTTTAPTAPSTTGVVPAVSSEPAATEALPSMAVGELPDALSRVPPRSRALPARVPAVEHDDPTEHAAPAPASRPTLRREVELIIAARQALTRGDAQHCLTSIALYDREYPAGQFALEGNMMRIEATAIAGDRARAAVLARELLTRLPGNPYEARLRSRLVEWEGQ